MHSDKLLMNKEFCILDAIRMTTLPSNHPLTGTGAKHLTNILGERFKETGTHEFAGIENCANNCVLLDIRDWYAGRADKIFTKVIALTLYFAEVKSMDQFRTIHLQERLEFAQATGFLLMGPDEAMAVVMEKPGEPTSRMVAAFMTDESGLPRTINDITDWSLEYHTTQRNIASLNETSVKHALEKTGDELLRELSYECPSAQRIALLKETMELLLAHQEKAQPERRPSGAIIRRWHISNGSAASIAKLTTPEDGWQTYPTSQDAWYFRVTINPRKRETMTYCEGDVSHVICDDQRQFMDELKVMAEFYGRDRSSCARGYDTSGGVTHYFNDLFFLQGKLAVVQFANDDMVEVGATPQAPLFGALMLDHPIFNAMREYPEVEFHIPADAIELDQLNPLAFQAYTCHALIHADGVDVCVKFASGKVANGMLTTKALEHHEETSEHTMG